MEPIITLTYMLSTFFGYYVSADIWNQIKFKSEFNEVKAEFNAIKERLDSIDSKMK
jgi:hypothetical protein